MTLAEFKAWLEGYSASFSDGAPSKEQWATISDKIEQVRAVSAPTQGNIQEVGVKTLPYIRPYWLDAPMSFSQVIPCIDTASRN